MLRLSAYILLLILLAGPVTGCHSQQATELNADAVQAAIAGSPPWRGSRDPTAEEWAKLLQIAKQLQTVNTEIIVIALQPFEDSSRVDPSLDFVESSRPYLLLRAMFELPECEQGWPKMFGGWICDDWSALKNRNWPLQWKQGVPELTQRFQGLDTGYSPTREYQYFRSHYPLRKL